MARTILLLAMIGLGGCGGGATQPPPDAGPDAEVVPVVEVSCTTADPAVTIGTAAGEYQPNPASIRVGEVAEWQMSVGHTARSRTAGLFAIAQGERGCYRFQVAGDYEFYCEVHGFTGVLQVR